MNHHNELERRAGDFGWIVSADALYPEITTLRDVTAALRHEARVEEEERVSGCASLSRPTHLLIPA